MLTQTASAPRPAPPPRPHLVRALGVLAVAFGALTVKAGGSVLFVDGAARLAAGDFVPFVVWFNFLAGFAYMLAGVGLWQRRPWAAEAAAAIALATAALAFAFGYHVWSGGAYEPRTVAALGLRVGVWLVIAALAWPRRGGA